MKNETNEAEETPSPLLRRLGRFYVSRSLLLTHPEQLRALFNLMIVVEAQLRWDRDSVEYVAMSEQFEEVPEYCAAPLYQITFRKDEAGQIFLLGITKGDF